VPWPRNGRVLCRSLNLTSVSCSRSPGWNSLACSSATSATSATRWTARSPTLDPEIQVIVVWQAPRGPSPHRRSARRGPWVRPVPTAYQAKLISSCANRRLARTKEVSDVQGSPQIGSLSLAALAGSCVRPCVGRHPGGSIQDASAARKTKQNGEVQCATGAQLTGRRAPEIEPERGMLPRPPRPPAPNSGAASRKRQEGGLSRSPAIHRGALAETQTTCESLALRAPPGLRSTGEGVRETTSRGPWRRFA
jgi:hypothetical protein